MENLFKTVRILDGKFKGYYGKITYVTSKYYIVEIFHKQIDGICISAVLFDINKLGITYEIYNIVYKI
jgi:ribosomal protein L24